MKILNEMAREAGFTEGELAFMGDNIIRLAEIVRADAIADEREACAKMCDVLASKTTLSSGLTVFDAADCAGAIRARGNT